MNYALVDGYNMAFRAFYGMPELTRSDGFPTGALHGWVRSLWWIEDNLKPDRLVVFFDLGEPVRHTELLADYKATRTETPEMLIAQIPFIKDWTRAMGYLGFERDGVEADDLIASYARTLARKEDNHVFIVSADKDLAQLVTTNIEQYLPPPTANPKLGWRNLDEKAVAEKFGVSPAQIPDYLALIGDTSDNIPGLRGVGPKTASKWLSQYKSLQGVLDHSGELQPKRFQSLVHAERDNLKRNLVITTLDDTLPVEPLPEPSIDADRAIGILREMEMKTSAEAAFKRIKEPF